MSGKFMIYGATGYTGKLLARTSKALGLEPLLAARNSAKLKSVAGQHGFAFKTIDLNDGAALRIALADVDAVLHAAGPFSATSKPMLDACLETRTHYLDVTGELDVLEACAERDAEAQRAGIMVMPGVGFDCVPSDCLAAHLKQRMPDANQLNMAIGGKLLVSRGSARTGIEMLPKGVRARRGGEIVVLTDLPERSFDFGQGMRPTRVVGLGDMCPAFHSTGIPEMTFFYEMQPSMAAVANTGPGAFKRWLLGRGFMQSKLKRRIEAMPEGPNDAQRKEGYAIIVAEALNAKGERITSRLRTPEGYTMTAMASLEILQRLFKGEGAMGYQTPSRVFGAGFITEFDGCTLQDID
jgi:short subunit dehydrogenase-like uncharacterized protein